MAVIAHFNKVQKNLGAYNWFLCRQRSFRKNLASSTLPPLTFRSELSSYEELYKFSCHDPNAFWGALGQQRITWYKKFDRVSQGSFADGRISWFLNGKLNVSVNCVDRHYQKTPDKVALIWERDEPGQQQYYTYKQLYHMMNQVANTLKSEGVKRGDRVVLYMPASPVAVATMMACARIGAVHSVVFAGFSADALASRIQDAKAETVVTVARSSRGGRVLDLKATVDDAVSRCPAVKRVFVSDEGGSKLGKKDISLEKAMARQPMECEPEVMDSEDLLFLLYTSGSTGKPKGVAHTQAGYLLFANVTHKMVFDYEEGDVFSCMADIGWITGHSYAVYGPLSNGATTVLFESTPTYPDPGRYWEMVQRLKVRQFYCAPTAIRLLIKYGDSWVTKYDRSSLKVLGSVGEPLNHEAWEWYHRVVGENRCPIVDTWWQTETGGILIAPRPSEPGAEIRPAMPMRPFFGVEPVLLNEKGEELRGDNVYGSLCIKKPWPGIARTLYGDHQRFVETYFKPYPGFYFTGDGAHRYEGRCYQITGRMDDVINVSGHRLGTAEIEDAMDEHSLVAETAVVGYPHEIKGEGIYAYVTLREGAGDQVAKVTEELRALVKKQIAAYAIPDHILITPALPKTRSGKIMRRILRKVAANKFNELGDTSTLSEPAVVDDIIRLHKQTLATGKPQK